MKKLYFLQAGMAVAIMCCILIGCSKEQYFLNLTEDNETSTLQNSLISENVASSVAISVKDIDGNVYYTIEIGTQVWLRRNLVVSRYNNGDSIPNISNNTAWTKAAAGAYCINPNAGRVNYGYYYNFHAVNDNRKLCPAGWHVPTQDDWLILEDYLGGNKVAGGSLKTTGTIEQGNGLWYMPNFGATNVSGFRGMPGGYRFYEDGEFTNEGYCTWLWTSTVFKEDTYTWIIGLVYDEAVLYHERFGRPNYGLNVRCIKD